MAIMKMRYSIENIYERYGLFSSTKDINNKYSQKLLDSPKINKSTADAIKTASKKAIRKTEESAGDLIGNKITDKITSVTKSSKKLHLQSKNDIKIPKERYISPEERQQVIDELRLVKW